MSVFTIIFRKAVSAILFIVNIFKKIFGLFWRKKESNIGELPYLAPTAVISQGHGSHLDGQQQQQHYHHSHAGHALSSSVHQPIQQNSWNSWNDTTFGVESKIEEYRKKQSEALQRQKSKDNKNSSATNTTSSAAAAEPDYFNDLRPEIKPQKRVQIDKDRTTTPIPRKNLFEFKENEIDVPQATEFGDLDFDAAAPNESNGGAWDDDLNVDEIDQVLKAQKQQERAERQKQRLLEHERRHHQKKKVAGD